MRHPRLRATAAAVVLVAALAGCTAGQEPDDGAPTAEADADGADGDARRDGGPVVIGAHEYEPIVEATFEVPRGEGNEVTVGLVSLVASGQTTELRLVMTPSFPDADDDERISVYDMFGKQVMPRLWDVQNLREYQQVADTGRDFETDVVRADVRNGEPVLYQAWFPFPEARPEALDVVLHPAWPVVEDVPVTYED